MTHTAAARRVLADLDAELAAAAKSLGRELVWTAVDRVILAQIADTIDRKVDLSKRYAGQTDTKDRIKLSSEIRLLEGSLERLLRRVKTDVPQPMSLTSQKAQRAAFARWEKTRATS